MAPNLEVTSTAASVATWRDQRAMAITSPKGSYSYSSGNYGMRLSKPLDRKVARRPVPVAIPEVYKARDRQCVGGKKIPFTRFNTIACRRKALKEDLDTIHESVYYTDVKWDDLIPNLDDMLHVDPRRHMAITFIQ